MRIDNPTKEELREYNDNLNSYVKSNNNLVRTLYVDLGVKTVRLLCYSEEFIPHLKKQLTYTLCSKADKYDTTIVLWKENDISHIYKSVIPTLNPKYNLRLRIELIVSKNNGINLSVFNTEQSVFKPLLEINNAQRTIYSYDKEKETYFYGVENLEPEEFIKQGHILVQVINNILKTNKTNLVHGACVGLNNNGVLFCARGQRGKSTLSVLSMIEGFEYVSDDYLTLEQEGGNLFAHPIYSIITLSPRMYNELYDKLDGCRFVSNNARKDKYVVNISKFHSQFKKRYPVKMCMFPEIVSDKSPSITECTQQEKGRAITHLIHSTIIQMNDCNDIKTIKKLIDMVKNFRFYKIYLCNDIYKNVECLRKFIKEYKNG